MDWGIIGLIDVIIILLFIITVLVGYHKGFLKKAIGLVSLFVAIVVAFVFCKQFANFLEEQNIIYGDLYAMIEAKVSGIEGIEYLDSAPDMSVAIQDAVGLPKFIATFLADKITENTSSVEIIAKVTTIITDILMVGVAWLLLFIIVFVGSLILKLIVHILRGNAIIKFVDGVIGVVFYVCILMLFIYSVFAIFKVVGDKEFFAPVKDFLDVDMKLEYSEDVSIEQYTYTANDNVTITITTTEEVNNLFMITIDNSNVEGSHEDVNITFGPLGNYKNEIEGIDFSNVEIVDTILTSNVNNGYFTIDVYKDSIITIKGTPDFVNYKFETNVDKFRLSKWIYEHNVVYSLFEFIFPK